MATTDKYTVPSKHTPTIIPTPMQPPTCIYMSPSRTPTIIPMSLHQSAPMSHLSQNPQPHLDFRCWNPRLESLQPRGAFPCRGWLPATCTHAYAHMEAEEGFLQHMDKIDAVWSPGQIKRKKGREGRGAKERFKNGQGHYAVAMPWPM